MGQTAGILGTAKETAIVIAEALAPGTTDLAEPTPVQTPAAATSTPEKAEQKQEPKSVEKTAVRLPASRYTSSPSDVRICNQDEPAPEPASITLPEPSVPPPAKEVEPEAVLPPIVKSSDVLPIVAVPLVPLAHEEPPMNGDSKPVETAVADNAPSTHTPIKPNGKGVQATEVALPPTTPTEVPLPSTPPTTNGKVKPSGPNSVTSTPSASANTTPHKERRSPFPTFGRKHRHSSSSHSVSEHGDISPQPSSPGKDSNSSLKGSARKKRMSIFHKIRDVFHHDEHGHRKEGSK